MAPEFQPGAGLRDVIRGAFPFSLEQHFQILVVGYRVLFWKGLQNGQSLAGGIDHHFAGQG